MHELSIAQELLRLCQQRLGAGQRLGTVQIAVGELAAVDPQLLRYAWEAVVAGTPHRDAALNVDWHPARQRCPDCGDIADRQAGSWLRLCPECRQPLRVEGGQELDLLAVGVVPATGRATVPASSAPVHPQEIAS